MSQKTKQRLFGWQCAAAAAMVGGLAVGSASAQFVLVNDTWTDGSRNEPAAPVYSEMGVDLDGDGDLESAWFLGGGGTLDPVGPGGPLRLTMAESGSSSVSTYFTPEATPVTLGAAGDQLRITWVFTPTGVNTANTGQSFRLAVVDSPAAQRIDSDATPGSGAYTGYAMFMNMNTTLGNSNSFQLRERATPGTGALLSAAAEWSALANGAGSGTPGYTSGTEYTFEWVFTRSETDALEITATMSGGTIGAGNQGFLTVSHTDASPSTFAFDMFHFRPSAAAETAAQFDTSLFRVEFIPEPSALGLVALAGLMLGRRRRV